jgi:hypothetical protein
MTYPRRKAKDRARESWNKLKPDESLRQVIFAAIEKQKNWPEWQRDNGAYIPHPATWLNQKRWEDEETTVHAVPKPKRPVYRGS